MVTLLENSDNSRACTKNPPLFYDDCIYEKLYELMLNSTGCTVPWLPKKSKICTNLGKSRKAFKIYKDNRRNQNSNCPNSCTFTDVNLGPPIIENYVTQPRQASAVFYFRKDVKTSTEYLIYTQLSMIAEIGGYVGLCLGISFVNIGTLINKILDCCPR